MEQKILNNNTRVTTKRYLMVNEFLQSRKVDTDYSEPDSSNYDTLQYNPEIEGNHKYDDFFHG